MEPFNCCEVVHSQKGGVDMVTKDSLHWVEGVTLVPCTG
jgi:hypothetical protein